MKKISKKKILNFWAIQCIATTGRKGYAFKHRNGHILASYEKDDVTPELFLTKKAAEVAIKTQRKKNKQLTDRKLKKIFLNIIETDYCKAVKVRLFLN